MTESVEVAIRLGLSIVAIAVVAALPRLRRPRTWLSGLAAASVAAYFNFFSFHPGGVFPHYWEHFHYFLAAKYFPELGYDGLYVASMGAEMRAFPGRSFQPFLRDLRTNEVTHTMNLEAHGLEVHRRFSPERWASFERDNAFFVGLDPAYLEKLRGDHGFNASPAWVAVARPWAAGLEASRGGLAALGALDLALLALAFVAVFRTFGWTTGCLALVVFGLGYPWRFFWTGGAFLRHDWIAALLAMACGLRRRRFGAAGACLGYAAMVRVFPLLVWIAPLVWAASTAVRNRSQGAAPARGLGWLWRMAGGFALAATVLLLAGAMAGRGASAWGEFARNLGKHSRSWLTNNVGLRNVVVYDAVTMRREKVDFSLPEPWLEWQGHIERRARQPWALGLWAALGGGLLGLAARRAFRRARAGTFPAAPDEDLGRLGVVAVFALATLTCYYWSLLLLFVLAPAATARRATIALLALSSLVAMTGFASPSFELRYGLMSWLLFAGFAVWLARSPEPNFRAAEA